jgi:uncharacterized protein
MYMMGACKETNIPALEYPPFLPPVWLRNAHVQTLAASRKPRRWRYGWNQWETMEFDLGKDGKIQAEASWQPGSKADSPALILFHGLEGSAQSHYIVGISKKAFAGGFHTIRLNTRNCGGTEHLTPTLYCAALSQDVLAVVQQLQQRLALPKIYACGVSLGANIVLKFLGEQGSEASRYLRGAAFLSAPIDLDLCARRMEEPRNWIYQHYFVEKLIQRMRRKTLLFPGIADMIRVERIRTIREFDDVVTAPHFGFGTAGNYYRLASSAPLLRDIRVPTMMIQAKDDPLIPFEPFLTSGIGDNAFLKLLATEHGGHMGFLGIRPACGIDQDAYWAECRAVQFLIALAQSNA